MGGALLVHGHRGSGKTSALRKIEALVAEAAPESVVVEIPLRQGVAEGVLLRDMIDEIRRTVRVRSDSGSLFKRISERLARIDLTVLGTGVGVTTTPGARYSNPLTIWRTCIDELGGVPLVLICIDDAELIEPAGLGTLKTLGESSGDVPVMLAVAGGPDFLARLSQRGSSPVARVFSGATFDMEELRLDETREAVLAPVRASGGRATGIWADAAIARIQDLSHGSPYLVQCLAYAAYRDESEITEGGVDASIRAAVTVAEPWLRQEIPHASDEDILSFLKLAETRKPNFRSAEILGLGIQSPYVGRLVKLGVLKKVARGHYDLRKAPVIAYYHSLRRRLDT